MGIAERDAFSDQIVSQIGREHVVTQRAPAARLKDLHGLNDARDHSQREPDVVVDEEHALLIHLEIFVVSRRQALQCHDYVRQLTEYSAGQSAHQLKAVGIELLRHERRTGREVAAQFNEIKFFGAEQDQILW